MTPLPLTKHIVEVAGMYVAARPQEHTVQTIGRQHFVSVAFARHSAIPAFNIPYLPMMEPVVRALADTRCLALIAVSRLEVVKFEARSLAAIRDEYQRVKDERYTRLHLDHLPVIDEDNLRIDFLAEIGEALALGYQSVMVDGSRLPLAENIAATAKVVALAHKAGVPVEAELGAVMGHEEGPLPPYEELFASGKGFTEPSEAKRFVAETGVDWLSVAIGNIHGAISKATKDQPKLQARLSIERLTQIKNATSVPLVLHGGTGIRRECVLDAIKNGIAKVNVATAIRQPYERTLKSTGAVAKAQEAVYQATVQVIRQDLECAGTADLLTVS
jgi:ketose-bisphosphate aldolase